MTINTAGNTKPVEFSCHAPAAQAVFVAGTFNDWRPEAMPLTREAGGHWRTTLALSSGHHEFKFIVDGQWCCEPGCEHEYRGCPKCAPNQFGTMNATRRNADPKEKSVIARNCIAAGVRWRGGHGRSDWRPAPFAAVSGERIREA